MEAIRRRTGHRHRLNSIAPIRISLAFWKICRFPIRRSSKWSHIPSRPVCAAVSMSSIRAKSTGRPASSVPTAPKHHHAGEHDPGARIFCQCSLDLAAGRRSRGDFSLWQSFGLCELRLRRCDLPVCGGLVLAKQSICQCGRKYIRDAVRSCPWHSTSSGEGHASEQTKTSLRLAADELRLRQFALSLAHLL